MSLLNWFKPLSKASAEGGIEQPAVSLFESQDSSQSTTAESAGIEQPLIESRDHSDPATDSDIPGEPTDITDECIGYTPSFTSESDEQHHHTLPPQPNQPKLKFPKRTFGKQKRSFLILGINPIHGYIMYKKMIQCCAFTVPLQSSVNYG